MIGKKAIVAWVEKILSQMKGYKVVKEEMEFHDIHISGDWASEWADGTSSGAAARRGEDDRVARKDGDSATPGSKRRVEDRAGDVERGPEAVSGPEFVHGTSDECAEPC